MRNQLSFCNNENQNYKFYVYILINNLNNEIFYVGKGNGNRKDQHIIEIRKIIENQKGKITEFKKIRDKRKYNNYHKMKLLYEILQNNGKIKSEIIFSNLSECDSFKIEQLLIFILKRRIEYLCIHKVKGKRKRYLRKFGGKLMNKSIGGESTGKKVVNEFANPSLIIENYPDIEPTVEKSDFIYKLKNKIFSNFTEIENYSTILNYLLSQKKNIEKEITDFKL